MSLFGTKGEALFAFADGALGIHDVVRLSNPDIGREAPYADPKSKITKSKRGMRRSHDAINNDAFVENKDTGELHRPHHIDLKTGMYNGKQILKVKTKN